MFVVLSIIKGAHPRPKPLHYTLEILREILPLNLRPPTREAKQENLILDLSGQRHRT